MRAVVIGASSGLGRCIGVGLAQRGARVALMARRVDRLADAAAEAGEGALAIACDVTDPASCRTAINAAVAGLGGIDAVVYAPGVGPLVRIEDADPATWHAAFDVNVVGANNVTAAALPHLTAAEGSVVYLSTVNGALTPPWPGLGVYAVTKGALDRLVEAWRMEHPRIGFTRVLVGECVGGEGDGGTEFSAGWDPEVAMAVAPTWVERKLLSGGLLEVEELVRVVDTVLRCGASASIPSVAVVPRPPA